MATSFGALCTDFYINAKLALKMDLPGERETILHLFDRVRKTVPSMEHFHRYEAELILESSRREAEYRWLSLRRTSVRTGHVNPSTLEQAFKYHKLVLQLAPYHLSVSPIDVDYLELLLGFDLECKGDHDQVVYEALYANSPLAELLQVPDTKILDIQPLFGMALTKTGDTQAFFEVKTRTRTRRGGTSRSTEEPLSILLTVRKYGAVRKIEELETELDALQAYAEALASERVVPNLVLPIARQITSSNA